MFSYGSAQSSHPPWLGRAVLPHSHPQRPGAFPLLKPNKNRADQAWSQNPGRKLPLLISCVPSISLLAPSPARLHPREPAVACRRKRPCHGCLRCVIVSVTLQIPFPCGGPGGVINRGGGQDPANKQDPQPHRGLPAAAGAMQMGFSQWFADLVLQILALR